MIHKVLARLSQGLAVIVSSQQKGSLEVSSGMGNPRQVF